jgi:hypothetical protein
VAECLELCRPPMHRILSSVHGVLCTATEASGAKWQEYRQAQCSPPASHTNVLRELFSARARHCLDGLQRETGALLDSLLHAEQRFPPPAEFAALKERLAALASGAAGPELGDALVAGPRSPRAMVGGTPSVAAGAGAGDSQEKWSDYFMGWLMKLNR